MILIVDDKKENLFSLQTLLTINGYEVEAAQSGEEALKKILQTPYSLIILDVQMPGMDGFEVAEMVSGYSRTNEIPIIFLSAVSTEKKFITKGYNSGAIDYITKPFDSDVFLLKVKTLHNLFEQKRQLTEMQLILKKEIEFRKQAQEESQEKTRQMASILESIPQIAFTTDTGGNLEYVNGSWINYGGSLADFPETHPEDKNLSATIKEMVKQAEPLTCEIRLRRKEQEPYRCFLLRAVPVKDGELIKKWVGTLTDIEEQKRVIQQKDEFISVASHELKTPLTSIKGYIQLLQRTIDPDKDSYRIVEKALAQTNKFQNLISDLFDVSKMESGKLELEMGEFEFSKLMANVLEMSRQTFPTYEFEQKGDCNALISGDELRLEQVLLNFLANAVKYSPNHKKIIIHEELLPGNWLKVTVEDFGIGIPQEDQAHIFDKFYRSQNSMRGIQGLGLGLYISSDILERHGARYGVESEPGKGSQFYFIIPIIKQITN